MNSHSKQYPSHCFSDHTNQIHYINTDHHESWYSFNGEQSSCSSYLLYDSCFAFRRSVFLRPCLYMLGSSRSNLSFRISKSGLLTLYSPAESKTPDHHVVLWSSKLWQRCILRVNTLELEIYVHEGSSYNATVVY